MTETFLYPREMNKVAKLNIWFAFPGIYSFGMSSIGYLSIFANLDKEEDIFVERIFTDTKNTKLKPTDVDLIGFSCSFELDFLSMFKILKRYNIPFESENRTEEHPIIYGGGPVLTTNPEPFSDFFDFIMIGDAENNDIRIINIIKENSHLSKKEVLKIISKLEGIYVPSLTKFDENQNKVLNFDGSELSVSKLTAKLSQCIHTTILSEESYFKNTFIIEMVRGCPNKCGFCLASYLNLPVRFCNYEEIISKIEFGLKHTNKIALLGSLLSAHPQFEKICEFIINKLETDKNIELTVSSLRADNISEKAVEMLVKSGQKHATVAIEAGSDRLRKVINKNLTEIQILNTVKTCIEQGLIGLKMYAMIGLPTETYEDLNQLIELCRKIKKTHKGFDLSLSFASFVPKAHTPFQYCQREDTKSLEKKYEYLKKEFHKIGIKINCSSVKWDYIQALLSRGDRRLGKYLVEVFNAGSNIGCFKNTYKDFVKRGELPDSDNFALKPIDINANLPWDFIKFTKNDDYLQKEYNRLLR